MANKYKWSNGIETAKCKHLSEQPTSVMGKGKKYKRSEKVEKIVVEFNEKLVKIKDNGVENDERYVNNVDNVLMLRCIRNICRVSIEEEMVKKLKR